MAIVSRVASPATSLDRIPVIRHLALCAAALAAFALRDGLRVGNSVLWVLGLAALFNLIPVFVARRPRAGRVMLRLSAATGLAGWIALMALTGGAASPFSAGLWLEVLLAGLGGSHAGLAATTAGAVAGLWGLQIVQGLEGWALAPALQTAFLLLVGAVTGFVVNHWVTSERRLARQLADQCRRLEEIERELDGSRALGRMGEGAARLAHGHKNATHSLRGFLSLLEPRVQDSLESRRLVEGLRTAIARLEPVARAALDPAGAVAAPATAGEAETREAVHEVVREISAAFPELRWSLSLKRPLRACAAPPAVLREVLMIVVRNAAESMQGRGTVAVEALPNGRTLEIRVRDQGPGIAASDRDRLFTPGFTTKPGGHGLGLFLARRLLSRQGGLLSLSARLEGGTQCSIHLPIASPPGAP